jgi:hypothetical protein
MSVIAFSFVLVAYRQKMASRMMIGSGMPSSQSRSPRPNPMMSHSFELGALCRNKQRKGAWFRSGEALNTAMRGAANSFKLRRRT